MKNRNGEDGAVIPARNERLFMKGQYWYFSTREGLDIGPFDSKTAAAEGVNSFIGYIGQIDPGVISRIARYIKAA